MTWILPALTLGLAGSLHCLGMCGPIAFVLPVSRNRPLYQSAQIASYHLGRMISYAAIGFIFGLLGRGIVLFGWQQNMSIGIGILMILTVIGIYFPIKKWSFSPWFYTMVGALKSKFSYFLNRRQPYAFLGMGLLNGLLPCGLVYMAVLGAMLTGDAVSGAAFMALFGLGTVPMMTFAVFSAGKLKGKFRLGVQRMLPIILLLFGILMVVRGLGLDIPYLSPGAQIALEEVSTEMNCH